MSKLVSFSKGSFAIVVLSILSPLVMAPLVGAADNDSVTATVTVTNISISVSSGSIAYGALSTSSTLDTTAGVGQLDNSQVLTNSSNVAIDVKVHGVTTDWTLGASAGNETYTHKTCVTDCDGTPTWVAMTTSYGDPILTGVAIDATPAIDFQIGTPTVTAITAEQNVNVTIMGVQN